MAGSPEEHPWGMDRKVPPLWGAGLKRNSGSAEPPEARRKGPGETGKDADPGQESWVTILEARPLALPSALFKSTKIQEEHSFLLVSPVISTLL